MNINQWSKLGAKVDAKVFRAALRDSLAGQSRTIGIGRSCNSAGYYSNIPIEVIEGDSPPELSGHPHLSTTFRRGSFTKILYTPSTLKVVVGRGWRPPKG